MCLTNSVRILRCIALCLIVASLINSSSFVFRIYTWILLNADITGLIIRVICHKFVLLNGYDNYKKMIHVAPCSYLQHNYMNW